MTEEFDVITEVTFNPDSNTVISWLLKQNDTLRSSIPNSL
jgi:hypothetical protein